MKCSNPHCKKNHFDRDALQLCDECMKEQATEYLNDPALRERVKAQENFFRKHGKHNRKEQE